MDRRNFLASAGASSVMLGRSSGAVRANPADEKPKLYRIVDTHLHLFNTRMQGKNGVPAYLNADATVESAVLALDRGGVDRAFLISYAAEDVAVQIRLRGVRPEALRQVMNKQYQVAAFQKHRNRFWWFTGHLDPLRQTLLDDLQKDFENGASGIKMLPWFQGVLPYQTWATWKR